ncbi:MAG: hypothetical protein K8R85_05795 [Bacteroidetes bacterium]|nr:hypothetical protein [Bacteroidota bacterium]
MSEKIKIKLTRDQLNIVFYQVQLASQLQFVTFEMKLITAHMVGLHKKLHPKWAYPSAKNNIAFTVPEALAFWLMFNGTKYQDPFLFATMNPILNEIHQKFI